MPGVKAGRLRELVDIELDASNDAEQDPKYRKTFMRDVPCSIATVGGDETFRGRQIEAGLSHIVELQRVPGVKPDMRLKVTGGSYEGQYLNVVYVKDMTAEGTPQRLQLYCQSVPTL